MRHRILIVGTIVLGCTVVASVVEASALAGSPQHLVLTTSMSVPSDTEDQTIYKVIVNLEEQFSIWPAYKDLPAGWSEAGKSGTKAECLEYIESVWTDMRPMSLRKAKAAQGLEQPKPTTEAPQEKASEASEPEGDAAAEEAPEDAGTPDESGSSPPPPPPPPPPPAESDGADSFATEEAPADAEAIDDSEDAALEESNGEPEFDDEASVPEISEDGDNSESYDDEGDSESNEDDLDAASYEDEGDSESFDDEGESESDDDFDDSASYEDDGA
ncbi:MbtH family NRPS accessory protein [Ahniella affigens]|nr:MbtH family NRPS accessory protein [Ahniella affigens]